MPNSRYILYFRVYATHPEHVDPDDVITDTADALRAAGFDVDYMDGCVIGEDGKEWEL